MRALNGLETYEYDLQFRDQPEDLPQVLTQVLNATSRTGCRVAWLAFEGSFHFDELLTDKVADQIYGVYAAGAKAPTLKLGDASFTREEGKPTSATRAAIFSDKASSLFPSGWETQPIRPAAVSGQQVRLVVRSAELQGHEVVDLPIVCR